MKQTILDDLRICKDPDCANPVLLDRALQGGKLDQEEQSQLSFFLDECQDCKRYFLEQLTNRQSKASKAPYPTASYSK